MNGRKLTIEQKDAIHGVFFNPTTFFNCVQDINDDWFILLSESDINNLGNFNYLLEISEESFTPQSPVNPF
jgi:hypothetical protein